jgi:hypothetical protein
VLITLASFFHLHPRGKANPTAKPCEALVRLSFLGFSKPQDLQNEYKNGFRLNVSGGTLRSLGMKG